MQMLATGMQRHSQSGTYYLLRRIPTEVLVCYLGKKEITFSLRTKDYRTAVERHRAEEARLTSECEEKRQRQAERYARTQLAAITRINALTPKPSTQSACMHAESASLTGGVISPKINKR